MELIFLWLDSFKDWNLECNTKIILEIMDLSPLQTQVCFMQL